MSTTAIIIALIPFVFSMSSSSSVVVDGMEVSYSSTDYVALICGAIAIAIATLEILQERKTPATEEQAEVTKKQVPLPLIAALLGAFQLVRGLGLL